MAVWVEHLSLAECWKLLAAQPVGRVGVLVDSAPEVYPVNHVVEGESIIFRTDPGNMLRGIDRSPSVSYEVDGFDPVDLTGWSVLVKGRAQELTAERDLAAAAELPLHLWSLGDKVHWIRIVPREVTGRRVHREA
jgi:nitroimidazol reductase NimA-like FMN-containing flavoprotein (pyridoxamine 5'-phosphate oxidase superfamily)